jgi:molybdopterin synthase catalytic subunit
VYRVTHEPLSAEALADLVTVPEAGGVTVFVGVVRDNTAGRRVVALEYEAHAPMAEAKMKEIGDSVLRRWPGIRQVAMVHRVGRLGIGEASVVIAVSAAHRGEAFDACEFAIDTLKQIVPIWKREIFDDGSVWVGLQGDSPPPAESPEESARESPRESR